MRRPEDLPARKEISARRSISTNLRRQHALEVVNRLGARRRQAVKTLCASLLSLLLSLLTANYSSASVPVSPGGAPSSRLKGNTLGDILWNGTDLWAGTDFGVARRTGQGWRTYGFDEGLGRGSIAAIASEGASVWVSTIYDTTVSGGEQLQVGDGLSVSLDGGDSWRHLDNTAIFGDLAGGPRTGINNGAFGLAMGGGSVWAAFFAGSLIRSQDAGLTWERVLPDGSQDIDYTNSARGLGQRTFSVLARGDTVWVGTAAGIARTTDGGTTWRRFKAESESDGSNSSGSPPGNWIVTLSRQQAADGAFLWAGARSTGSAGESEDVAFSSDGGETWQASHLGESAWNFAFQDLRVWATTDHGLFVCDNPGAAWQEVKVTDPEIRETLRGSFVGVETVADTVWVGAENGMGCSTDGGKSWRILQGPMGTRSIDDGVVVPSGGDTDQAETYAFPTPFSPARDGLVRVRYSLSRDARVTIAIYDFAGRPVKLLIENEPRVGASEPGRTGLCGENWDGRNGRGDVVANGTYFYRITADRGQKAFGKIVVVD